VFTVNPRIQGVAPELLELYKTVCPSTIGHMTDFGFLKGLQPIFRPIHFVGNAVTVRIPHMDSTAVHKVLDIVEPGDIVVVDMSGDIERSCWGEMVTYAAKVKKVAGVVVAGCVNDFSALIDLKLPIFSLGVSPITTRILGLEGEINTPVSVCGVTINPGDLIVADDDGVFAVSPDKAWEYGKSANLKQAGEPDMKRKLEAGQSLAGIGKAGKYFA
jgi:4-hydroxy-4-methyl-2-oxoglutarate aldolase